jgi:glycosyltransferase 2 family protein
MIEPPTPTFRAKTIRKRIFTVVRVLVSVGLLVAVLRHMGVDNTIDALRGTSPWWVLVVLALMLLEGLHGTYKWLILLRHTDHDVRFWPLFRITYISGFVGMFLPGAVGIELVRMYGLAKQTSDLAMSFTSILMDRILGLTGLSLTILIGVFLVAGGSVPGLEFWADGAPLDGQESIPGIEYWAGGVLLLIIAGWIAIMNPCFRRFTDWMLSAPILAFVRDKQNKIYASLDTYRSRPGLLAWAMLQSLLYNGIRIAVCYTAGLAVGVEAPVAAYIVAVPVVIFVMLIPISVAGWGVRELMFVSLLTAYGADGDKVAAMSILVGLLGTVSILPGALFCMQGIGRARAGLRGD